MIELGRWARVPVINMETITHPCQELALAIVRGGEGATKLVQVNVTGDGWLPREVVELTFTETATTPFSSIQLRVTLTGGELTRVDQLEQRPWALESLRLLRGGRLERELLDERRFGRGGPEVAEGLGGAHQDAAALVRDLRDRQVVDQDAHADRFFLDPGPLAPHAPILPGRLVDTAEREAHLRETLAGDPQLGDGPHLVGEVRRELVDVVGEVLPDAADLFREGLAQVGVEVEQRDRVTGGLVLAGLVGHGSLLSAAGRLSTCGKPRTSYTMAAVPTTSLPDRRTRVRFRRRLLAWYARHRRDLPWRRTRDPYAILVSEVMLQQTQVARVVPRYEAWLARWPTADALAAVVLLCGVAVVAAVVALTPLALFPIEHTLIRGYFKVWELAGRRDLANLDSGRDFTKAASNFSWYGPLGSLLFVAAAVIVFPWLFTLYMSAFDWKIGEAARFVGVANYIGLATNQRFIESYMVGLNHEFARELRI